MADMSVSWGLSADDAFSELAKLEAVVEASAAKQAAAMAATSNMIDEELARTAKAAQAASTGGLGEMEKATKSLHKAFFTVGNVGHAVFAGIAGSVAIGTKALDEYAKKNEQVAQDMAKLEKAGKSMLAGIGRGLSGGLRDVTGALEVAEKLRASLSDGVHDFWTGQTFGLGAKGESAADKNAAYAAIEEQDRAIKVRVEKDKIAMTARIAAADEEGKLVEAARLRGQQRRQKAAKGFNEYWTVSDKQSALALIDEQTAKEIAAAKKKEDLAKADKAAELERARQSQLWEERGLSIQIKRQQQQTLSADLDEINLNADKKRAEIDADKTKTEAEKIEAKKRLATLTDSLSNATVKSALDEEAKKKADRDAEMQYRQSTLELELAGLDVNNLRLEGKRKEADLLELNLETQKKILDIERDQSLSDEQKRTARDRISDAAAREGALIRDRKDDLGRNSVRGIMGGTLGGRALEAMTFGGESSNGNAVNTMMRAEVDQVKLLSRIASAVEKKGGLVLGR